MIGNLAAVTEAFPNVQQNASMVEDYMDAYGYAFEGWEALTEHGEPRMTFVRKEPLSEEAWAATLDADLGDTVEDALIGTLGIGTSVWYHIVRMNCISITLHRAVH